MSRLALLFVKLELEQKATKLNYNEASRMMLRLICLCTYDDTIFKYNAFIGTALPTTVLSHSPNGEMVRML